jgi:hypothetical protein
MKARRKLAMLWVLAAVPVVGLAVPANAAPPAPRVTSPTADQNLTGTVTLTATAADTAETGIPAGIIKVEWWLYTCGSPANDAGSPCAGGISSPTNFTTPENPEGKALLGDATVPVSGTVTNGTWRSSWTVAPTITSRGHTYDVPAGRYAVQAHVLDHAWEGTNPPATWGAAPVGVSPFVPVTIGGPPPAVNLSGFTLPTAVEELPNGRVYVAEKDGIVKTAGSFSATTKTTVIDIRAKVGSHKDHGLTNIVYLNGFLYTLYTLDRGYHDVCNDEADVPGARGCPMDVVLTRWPVNTDGTVGAESAVIGPGAWCVQFATHGGDNMEVRNGELWISAGDGAGFNDADYGQYGGDPCGGGGALRSQAPHTTAFPGRYNGKIIRIGPTGTVLGVEAKGLRNPWRFTFLGNDLYTTDTGWYTYEEINRVSPGGTMENFGWPCFEGPQRVSEYAGKHLAPCETLYTSGGVTAPTYFYRHNSLGVSSITAIEGANGKLYFGDYTVGFIKSINPDGSGEQLLMTGVSPVDLKLTSRGLVYVDIVAGAIRTVEAGTVAPPPPPPPTPTANISVSQEPWEPGQTLAFSVQSNVIEARQPHTIRWTVKLFEGSTASPLTISGQGQPSGTVVAPAAASPASIEFQVTVTNSAGAFGEDSKSVSRAAMDVPAGTNLLQNPSLEVDADSDGNPDCWTQSGFGSNTASWARSSTQPHTGSWAERLVVTNYVDGDRKLIPTPYDSRCAPTVESGKQYRLGLWYLSSSPAALEVVVFRRDMSGNWSYWFSGPGLPSSTAYNRTELTTPPVPAGVSSISFGLALSSAGTLVTDDYVLSPLGAGPADTTAPTVAWSAPAGGATVSGAVTLTATASDNTGVASVELKAGSTIVTVDSSAPYTASWTSTGAPNGPVVLTATARDAAGNTKSVTRTVTVSNGAGLPMTNASLETDADGNGVPDCFQRAGFGSLTPTWARITGGHTGSAQRVTVTGYANGDTKLLPALSGTCAPKITAGRTYTLGLWYQSVAPALDLVAFIHNSRTNAWSYWISGPALPTSAMWRQVAWTTPVVPADTDQVSWGIALSANGALAVDDFSIR